MKHSIDYLSMIQSIPAHRTALIEDGQFYTYGSLTGEAWPHPGSLGPGIIRTFRGLDQGGFCA